MSKIAILYGSTTGNTESAARSLKAAFEGRGHEVKTYDVGRANFTEAAQADLLVMGVPTWNVGQLQSDWENHIADVEKLDLAGKMVALFGFGDQQMYSDTFQDAMATLAASVRKAGGVLVGEWATEGYTFDHSEAVENGHFVGLALDQENQPELTESRLETWAKELLPFVSAGSSEA